MTSEEFASSIQRGSGRAALHLLDNDLAPYLRILLDACLSDDRETVWIEDGRAPYLLSIATLTGVESLVEDAVLDGLPKIEEEWDALQGWRILNLLAQWGYSRSRTALLAHALRNDAAVTMVADWDDLSFSWLKRVRPDLLGADLQLCHDFARCITHAVDRIPVPRLLAHLEWVIDRTPCSFYRLQAYKKLAFDAEPATRALVSE